MKITKYPQSCLLIEDSGKRLIIDPGSFVNQKYKVTELLPLDAILITHEHADHVDVELLKGLVGNAQIPVVGNQSTRQAVGEIINQVVTDGQSFEAAGFKIIARELPHCAMVDGSPGPQNTGYLIDGVFFHPGDGTEIDNLKVDNAAVPIAGPDISPRDIYSLVREINCKKVIPIHYNYFPNDPQFVAGLLKGQDSTLEVIVLADGESTEI